MDSNTTQPQIYTSADLQLAQMGANVINIDRTVQKVEHALKAHIESTDTRNQVLMANITSIVKDLTDGVNKRFDEVDRKSEANRKEHQEQTDDIRTNFDKKITDLTKDFGEKFVTNRDFKVVWGVAGALITIA